MGEELKKYVESKYKEELRKLAGYWPAEYPTLREVSQGKRTISLQTGGTHSFDEAEVSRLLEAIPPYFHEVMRVPITVRYEKVGGVARYHVLGDQWQRRLVEILLTGTYTYRGREHLTINEFIHLLRRFKSMVFVSVTI